ncbi:MAG: hypothetical protein K2X45_17550 [Phreatobacter sp.]|nr:hypothetical protein [Phreatobacter sp.]
MTTVRTNSIPGRALTAVAVGLGLCLAAVPSLAQSTAPGASGAGALVITAGGRCTELEVSGEKFTCSAIMYMRLANGRAGFLINRAEGPLSFFGSRDSQPIPERYSLEVDTLHTGFPDGRTKQSEIAGRCTLRLSGDGSIFHKLECTAGNGLDQISLIFEGDGQPVKQMQAR